VVNFEIPTTVPVVCNAIGYSFSGWTVEHKKLRIRHKILYINFMLL